MKKLRSILLIDDDEATNNLNQYLLSSMNLSERFEVAVNGQQGLDFINNCSDDELPDLILLDINMPLMNGFEFLEQFSKLPKERKNSITLLMLTTSQNPLDLENSKQYRTLSGYIDKPLLKSKINEIWEIYFSD